MYKRVCVVCGRYFYEKIGEVICHRSYCNGVYSEQELEISKRYARKTFYKEIHKQGYETRREFLSAYDIKESVSYVYFIQCGDNGPIKIGHTKDIDRRLSILQGANPQRLNLLGCFLGDSIQESELHKQFKGDRISGEWFNSSNELLNIIQGLIC